MCQDVGSIFGRIVARTGHGHNPGTVKEIFHLMAWPSAAVSRGEHEVGHEGRTGFNGRSQG